MQRIIHAYENVSPLFNDIEKLYQLVSEFDPPETLIPTVLDNSFDELVTLLERYGNWNYFGELRWKEYQKIQLPTHVKNIVLCFSGGKDSIAAALHYKRLGYSVYLYHMRHINFALSDEWVHSIKLAEALKMPLYIDEVKVSGHHDWCEHPMKNMIIANGALNYAIREGIGTKVAFGNYYTSSVLYDRFDFCGGDDQEMWRAYEHIIQRIIPRFHVYVALKNLGTTLNRVCKEKELLELSVSCLGRANLRNYRWQWVKDKFGVTLPKNRCGSCYKCCIEYIYMADHDLTEFNEGYYRYCINQLKKNSIKEYGAVGDLWSTYFFYDKKKSKCPDALI